MASYGAETGYQFGSQFLAPVDYLYDLCFCINRRCWDYYFGI